MKNSKIGFIFCTMLLISVLFSMTSYAESKKTVVRVAYPTQEGMSFIGNSGKVTGYNYDYLEKISEYTGLEMEYIPYSSNDGNEAVGNAINDLMEGKVDLLGPLLKSEQTEKLFEFPKHSYGTVYTTLCALSTSDLRENNIHQQKKLKVGLWDKAQVRNSEVIAFLDSEKISYKITYYSSADEQNKALIDKKVDVISSVSLSPVANSRIVAQFAARPYYFAAPKGSTQLVKQLDEAIEKINQSETKLQDNLYDKYFRNTDDVFLLTNEEKEKLKNLKTLHALCVENDAPYVYQRNDTKAGVLISILDGFAKQVDINIEYTFCKSRSEAEQMMKENQYDLFIGSFLTSKDCAKLGYINSVPVIESVLAFAKNPSGTNGTKIALVKGLEEQIDTSEYAKTILCDSINDCLKAIESGKADIAAGDRSSLTYYIILDVKLFYNYYQI